MSYQYWLPDEQNRIISQKTDNNSIIIIGANGSGKSKLGAWIEQQNLNAVHRIGAQRNLNFTENLPLKNYNEAEQIVFYGSAEENNQHKGFRWNWGHYTTNLINDFDHVLAALIALKNNENEAFVQRCKEAEIIGKEKPPVPITSIDKLKQVWSAVLPTRRLSVEDSRFFTIFEKDGVEKKYSATEMSDGERSVLYLTAQVLCVPNNKILIIDEPEIHLHRSIMNKLWETLEKFRTDCLFIYITHDLQFAAAHSNAEKIWIREFDGIHWKFEKIIKEDIPEELSFEILGNRKNVLFVEGEKNSYDYQLYSQLYKNYLIIPCGSCLQVVTRTKAFKASKILHNYNVYGLIDRDFRSEYEIEALKKYNIFVLEVAEVENLFIVEDLLRFMAIRFGTNPDDVFISIKNFIINVLFANKINQQICQNIVADIKYNLSCIEISNSNDIDVKTSFESSLKQIDFDMIKNEEGKKYKNALEKQDYKNLLRIFNEKKLASSIGRFLGINNNDYQNKVITLLQGECYEDIAKTIIPYLPDSIPLISL